MAGADAVIAYLVPPTPGVNGNPLKSVVGFDRVYLDPGQKVTLNFPVTAQQLSPPNHNGAAAWAQGLALSLSR